MAEALEPGTKGGLRSRDGMEVHLETVQVGGTKCIRLEAIQSFFDGLWSPR